MKGSQIKRHPDRSVPNEVPEILARGLVAHVAFCDDRQPFVIPFSYHYDPTKPEKIYLHGATSNRALQHIVNGTPVCISVTLVDGLVYSRTAKYHSMNYRSVVLFGRARIVEEESEKRALFEKMIDRHFAGRTAGRDYEPPPSGHLNNTLVVEVTIEESSAKARMGGPAGPHDADADAAGTCGVLPVGRELNPIRPEKPRDVQVRLAEPADAPAIASLLYNSFVEYTAQYTPEGFATTVSTPDQVQARIKEGPVWVALENRAVVGTVSTVLKAEGLYIRGMAVDPSARGKRVGRKLLDCVELFAVKMRCSRLFLSTTPFLTRAIKLYENYGFHRHSEGPDNLFGTPLFTMVKALNG